MTLDSHGIVRASVRRTSMFTPQEEDMNILWSSIQSILAKVKRSEIEVEEDEDETDYERNYEDDLPLKLARGDGPGTKNQNLLY